MHWHAGRLIHSFGFLRGDAREIGKEVNLILEKLEFKPQMAQISQMGIGSSWNLRNRRLLQGKLGERALVVFGTVQVEIEGGVGKFEELE